MNDPSQVKGPDGKVDQNSIYLFQRGITNATVDARRQGDERFWSCYLTLSLAQEPFFSPGLDKPEHDLH